MSIESLWYQSYIDGEPPTCNRLTRMPHHRQMGMAFRLAVAVHLGQAGYRNVGQISTTGETYWHWPDAPHAKYGSWWLLPPRTVRMAEQAKSYAVARLSQPRAAMPPWALSKNALPPSLRRSPRSPSGYNERILVELRRLERRAVQAGRAMEQREGFEWRARTQRAKKLTASLRPDLSALHSAAWLRSVRAGRDDLNERPVPAMVYVAREKVTHKWLKPERSQRVAMRHLRRYERGLLGQMAAISARLSHGEQPGRIAIDLGITRQRLMQIDSLSRMYWLDL